MITFEIVIHAWCNNEWKEGGKTVCCHGSDKSVFDSMTYDIDDARDAAIKKFQDNGWKYFMDGRILCPQCSEFGVKPV